MKSELTILPMATIHPDKIHIYNTYHWEPKRSTTRQNIFFEKDESIKYKHLLNSSRSANYNVSNVAKRKILKTIEYLLLISNPKTMTSRYTGRSFKFKISFITLTLPSKQKHPDSEIKSQLLNHFLIVLRNKYKVRNYIWRAEKQKNGNIHFHILIDKFVPYQELRDLWNNIINKLGYVDRYRETQINWHRNGFKVRKELLPVWNKEKQYKAYLRGAKQHWNSPNSTDIHSVHKIHNLKSYLIKYLSKEPDDKLEKIIKENKEIHNGGRIWSCSQELSNIKGAQSIIDWRISDELEKLEQNKNIYKYKDKYFTTIYYNIQDLSTGHTPQLFKLFCVYLLERFNYNLQFELNPN